MAYKNKKKNTVTCFKCKNETTEYTPKVVNNRPQWVCKECG